MPRRRELPYDPTLPTPRGPAVACLAADTDWAALMQTRPNEDPQPSRAALLPMRDVIQDAIDDLNDREHWIFDAIAVERKSFREVGRELSLAKSWVHRLYLRAVDNLQAALAHEPIIVLYLEREMV